MVAAALLVASLVLPATAFAALKAYNYGQDFYPSPWENYDLSDAGDRAGARQDVTTGLYARWPQCDRDWASNVQTNMQSPITAVINVVSHGGTDDFMSTVVLFPPEGSGVAASLLYSRTTALPYAPSIGITNRFGIDVVRPTSGNMRLQGMGTIPPSMKLIVFQGCSTAFTGATQPPVAKVVVAEGADTGVGFTGHVLISGATWPSGYSWQERWAEGYWGSLSRHNLNSKAMDDGAALVKSYFGSYGAYDTHARWGVDCRF